MVRRVVADLPAAVGRIQLHPDDRSGCLASTSTDGDSLSIASLDQLERRLSRWCDRGLGRTWVVAVSGGSDSVGLLRILHQLSGRLDLTLSVAHLDHGTRGEASRADAALVCGLAGSLELPVDLGEWRPERTGHFEADARRARYAWLTQIARARGAAVIAVGHTHDDQAETILQRILRGTGPRGLSGMAATRRLASGPSLMLARPLLEATRREIREYLAALGQPYREDASNADRSRTRARLRHDLLPKLAAEYNPDVAGALVRLGSLARALERSLEAELRRLVHQAVLTRASCFAGSGDAPAGPRRACRRSAGGGWLHWLGAAKFLASWSGAVSRYRPTSFFWFCAVSIIQRHPAPHSSPSNRSRSWFPVARRSPGPRARSKSASIQEQGPSATKRSIWSNWLCPSWFADRRPAIGSARWACRAQARRWRISFEAGRFPARSVRAFRWCVTGPASFGLSGTGFPTGSNSPRKPGALWV
jgi:tRNA(Ile)-lysidine synthetase-like protein